MNTVNSIQPDFIIHQKARMNFLWGPAETENDEFVLDQIAIGLEADGINTTTRIYGGRKYLYRSTIGFKYEAFEDAPKKNWWKIKAKIYEKNKR